MQSTAVRKGNLCGPFSGDFSVCERLRSRYVKAVKLRRLSIAGHMKPPHEKPRAVPREQSAPNDRSTVKSLSYSLIYASCLAIAGVVGACLIVPIASRL